MEYEKFKEMVCYGEEFEIMYNNKIYNVSQNMFSRQEAYFTIDEDNYYVFKSYEELLAAPLFDGKTIEEKWNELEVY